jgi:hypothetical protein
MSKYFAWLAAGLAFILSVVSVYFYLSPVIGTDWHWAYYPASRALMAGQSPYFGTLFNPPWVLLAMIPVALLPAEWGASIMFVAELVFFLVVMFRLKVHLWLVPPLVVFSGMLFNSTNANIDGLCALGFILPPPVGLFFVLAKPQIGVGVAAYWAWCAWRGGGWRKLVRTFAPVMIAYGLSFIVYGNWMNTSGLIWSASTVHIFPFGVPLGIMLVILACRRRSIGPAIAAGVLFAPYVNSFTWSFLWLGMAVFASELLRKPKPARVIVAVRSKTAHP